MRIALGDIALTAMLDDSPTVRSLASAVDPEPRDSSRAPLPIESTIQLWGDGVHFLWIVDCCSDPAKTAFVLDSRVDRWYDHSS